MARMNVSLQALIEPAVTVLGYELVGVVFSPSGKGSLLRVYIDSEEGITADDCGRVSHQVSGLLDVEDPIPGHYTLEVSSPGLERPLFTPEHYRRFSGERVQIKLRVPVQGRRKVAGILQGCEEGNITVVEDGEAIVLPLDAVGKAHLDPETMLRKL